MNKKLKLGIGVRDVLHNYKDNPISLEDWFKEISQCNIFDYVDKTPPKSDFNSIKNYQKNIIYLFSLVVGSIY